MEAVSIWRAGELLLVAIIGEQFWIIDATGRITRRYEPRRWRSSIENGQITYVVQRHELVERTLTGSIARGPDIETRVVLAGLELADDADTQTFVQTVLDDEMVAAEARRGITE